MVVHYRQEYYMLNHLSASQMKPVILHPHIATFIDLTTLATFLPNLTRPTVHFISDSPS